MTQALSAPRVAGNQNTSALKLIALVFMCFDHFGKMIFPTVPEMRMLGRIAFPIYCYCVVFGACHTKSAWRYALRLLLVGLVSQPLYMLALNHSWNEPNIFLTLLLGLLGIYAMQEKKYFSHIWGPILALLLANIFKCDYGYKGVLLMLLLYMARSSKATIAAVMIAFCLYWGSGSSPLTALFGLPLTGLTNLPYIGTILQQILRLQGLAILALPFMLIDMPMQFKMPKWLGYALYPAHLGILYLVEQLIG